MGLLARFVGQIVTFPAVKAWYLCQMQIPTSALAIGAEKPVPYPAIIASGCIEINELPHGAPLTVFDIPIKEDDLRRVIHPLQIEVNSAFICPFDRATMDIPPVNK